MDTLRLSPLAFPRNPYQHLVKHYQDGGLKRGRINDPELDSRLALELFSDQRRALRSAASDLLAAWHWLTTPEFGGADRALDDLFTEMHDTRRPTDANARATHGRQAVATAANARRPFAYALAWLSVAGGNSAVPPWVRHKFPETGQLVRWLRDTACNEAACGWCRERHDARKELKR